MHVLKKGKCILLLIILSVLILPCGGSSESAEENLLYNGDFEKQDAEGFPDGWFTDAYLLDPGYSEYACTAGMDGENSKAVTIRNTAKNDARFAQTVQVKPDTLYCLSGYIRAENVSDGHGANLSVEGVYAFSTKVYETEGEWQYIEYYGFTGPDQYYITVFARLGGYSGESKGTASFDRLSLVEVEELPEDVLADPWYTAPVYDADDDWTEPDQETGKTGPYWPKLLMIGFIYCFVLIAVLYYFRDGKENRLQGTDQTGLMHAWPFLLLALLLRMIVSYFSAGYDVDVNCFTSWGYTMAHAGPAGFYLQTSFCDYPPLYTYIMGLNSWLAELTGADAGLTRVIHRFIPSLCDIAGCWILLHYPDNQYTKNRQYRILIVLLMFNPVTVLNSAAWGQMDSVLCILLLLVAVFAMQGKWIPAITAYVTAVLVKPQALMLGFLGLTFMVIAALREKYILKRILIAAASGILLIAVYVLPFGINQQPGWLVQLYSNTLASYPYASVNTANLYYLFGGNWSNINTAAHFAVPVFFACMCAVHGLIRFFRNRKEKHILTEIIISSVFAGWFIFCAVIQASWAYTGTGAMAYAFVIVLNMAIRKKDISILPYLGALLFILLYVFGIKMHERYLFPAFLLMMCAWAVLRDRRILFLILLFSFTVFVNEGIVLDNSIRLGSAAGHLNQDTVWLADFLSVLNVIGALYAVYLGYQLMYSKAPGEIRPLPGLLPIRKSVVRRSADDYIPDKKLHWSLRDTLILCCITAAYSAVSLTTLGSSKAPQSAWSSSGEEEQIVFDLQDMQNDVRVLYFAQVSRNDFSVSMSDDGINWSEETWAQMDQGQCWKWKYVTQSALTASGSRTYYNNEENIIHFYGRYIRITSHQIGLILNEIVFRDKSGSSIHAEIVSRTGDNPESALWSDPNHLTDEPDTLENLPGIFGRAQDGETQPSWWNSTYFDEIYHARTGFEFLHGTVPYETSHPPLGKVLISWCIGVFGMTPFGWRFAGALAGILMLPGIYLTAKQLTKKTGIAFFACMLMALDCMHLTQTQIATIDSFPVVFIIFAYFFMLRFIQTDLAGSSTGQVLIPLAFSGLFMGLSIASKWIGIYAGIGLAILYFWHCIRYIVLYRRRENPNQTDIIRKVCFISLWCVLFFIVVPLTIYLLSYIPYMAYNTRIKGIGDYLSAVWRAQESMFSYHSTPGLGMDHPFYSPWWEWPIIGKPMFYATEQYIPENAELHHSIFCFGNPVIWWGSLGASAIILFRFLRGKHYQAEGETQRWHMTSLSYNNHYEFVFIGLLAQYLPWVLVPRGTYIYHYFASVPFLILITSLCLLFEGGKYRKTLCIAGGAYILLALLFFIFLFPYSSGMAAPAGWLDIGKHILRIWY